MTSFTSWDSELYHHGIKGQKWGVRKFQNEDGSLTPEGERRYGHKKNYKFGAGLFEEAQRTRLLDADRKYGLGSDDLKQGRVAWYQNRINRARLKKMTPFRQARIKRAEKKLSAQVQANANREAYNDHSTVAKLWVQNKLFGSAKAERYRDARARGDNRARAFIEGTLANTPIGVALRRRGSKKAYGTNIKW